MCVCGYRHLHTYVNFEKSVGKIHLNDIKQYSLGGIYEGLYIVTTWKGQEDDIRLCIYC